MVAFFNMVIAQTVLVNYCKNDNEKKNICRNSHRNRPFLRKVLIRIYFLHISSGRPCLTSFFCQNCWIQGMVFSSTINRITYFSKILLWGFNNCGLINKCAHKSGQLNLWLKAACHYKLCVEMKRLGGRIIKLSSIFVGKLWQAVGHLFKGDSYCAM